MSSSSGVAEEGYLLVGKRPTSLKYFCELRTLVNQEKLPYVVPLQDAVYRFIDLRNKEIEQWITENNVEHWRETQVSMTVHKVVVTGKTVYVLDPINNEVVNQFIWTE